MKSEFYVSSEKVNKIYECLNNNRKGQFGSYRKCVFHLHTPASYDYKLLEKYTDEKSYLQMEAKDIFDIIIEKNIVPKEVFIIDDILYDKKKYVDLKEYLTYFLIASQLVACEVELVVVTDHNTISGYSKLSNAMQDYWKYKRSKKYPEIMCGIEISCADKNHIVGIFDYKGKLENQICEWLDEYIMSVKEGTYLSSVEVLKQISKWNGIGYIGHIDTSDIFKESFFSHTFKKVLFSLDCLEVIGVSNIEKIEDMKKRISPFSKKEFNFVVDEDSHCLEQIGTKAFWIKGVASDFKTIKKAIRDYNISVELNEPSEPEGYIKGMYVVGKESGFLSGKDGEGDFVITFSNSLNCFIGGRGTGKSTALQMLDFVLGQNYVHDNRLELICGHEEIWILYSKGGLDYLILFNVPTGEYNTLESAVEQMRKDFELYGGMNYHEERVNLQRKYIQIFRMRMNRSILEEKEMVGISETLSAFFDTKYSVNELVQYASTSEISQYIKSTIQKNNKISKIKVPAYVWTKKGLSSKVQVAKKILEEREQEILEIIEEYNRIHKNDLQITYSFHHSINNVIDFRKIFPFMWSKGRQWFCNFNIANESVVAYFEQLHDLVGTIRLYELISEEKFDELESYLPLELFTEPQTFKMVEDEIIILHTENKKIFWDKISQCFFSKIGMDTLMRGLQQYIRKCEKYNLLFNINNKEEVSASKPILRSIDRLSMGQKVVAMLSFVLSYSDFSHDYRPLIIDQPEDNLDNQYIYKNLVKQLRNIKSKRQVIIATHNATIVTNAKAEQVIVMESDNTHGWVKSSGYPNDKRIIKHIVNNLEGGKESFEHKCFIYSDVIGRK